MQRKNFDKISSYKKINISRNFKTISIAIGNCLKVSGDIDPFVTGNLVKIQNGVLLEMPSENAHCTASGGLAHRETGKFPVRPLGFAAWRPHKDNRQNTKKVH